MKTKILKSIQIQEAVNLLKSGQIIALPTETVYGLAADATNESAINKVFTTKCMPANHPLIVHIDSFNKVKDFVDNIPDYAKSLAECFWPGPLTMIFNKKKEVSNVITGNLSTIALRVPNHLLTLEVIKKLGTGIAAPSANIHKKVSPTRPAHVLKTLSGKIPAILDGGVCSVGIESTILDITKSKPVILRPGSITASLIKNKLNIDVVSPIRHNEKVSGNMHSHYQTNKPIIIGDLNKIMEKVRYENNVAVMHYSKVTEAHNVKYFKMPSNKIDYCKNFYEVLHTIDSLEVEKIFIESPPDLIEWSDVNDRLNRAKSECI